MLHIDIEYTFFYKRKNGIEFNKQDLMYHLYHKLKMSSYHTSIYSYIFDLCPYEIFFILFYQQRRFLKSGQLFQNVG